MFQEKEISFFSTKWASGVIFNCGVIFIRTTLLAIILCIRIATCHSQNNAGQVSELSHQSGVRWQTVQKKVTEWRAGHDDDDSAGGWNKTTTIRDRRHKMAETLLEVCETMVNRSQTGDRHLRVLSKSDWRGCVVPKTDASFHLTLVNKFSRCFDAKHHNESALALAIWLFHYLWGVTRHAAASYR